MKRLDRTNAVVAGTEPAKAPKQPLNHRKARQPDWVEQLDGLAIRLSFAHADWREMREFYEKEKLKRWHLRKEFEELVDRLGDHQFADHPDGIRLKAQSDLNSVLVFLMHLPSEDMAALNSLTVALRGLNDGIIAPMLRPRRAGRRRKPDSEITRVIKDYVAALCTVINEDNGLGILPAARRIAHVFAQEGVSLGRRRQVDVSMVINWRKAAIQRRSGYHELLADFRGWLDGSPPEPIVELRLHMLEHFLRCNDIE